MLFFRHTAGTDYMPFIKEEIVFSPESSAVNNSMSCAVLTIINDSALENTEALSAILTTDQTVVLIPSANISATIFIIEDPYDCKKYSDFIVIQPYFTYNIFFILIDITVGFASDTPNTAIEGLNLTLMLCPKILNGSLEKDVFVFATTMDITAKG